MANKAREQHKRMVRQEIKAARRNRRDAIYSAVGEAVREGVLSQEDMRFILPRRAW